MGIRLAGRKRRMTGGRAGVLAVCAAAFLLGLFRGAAAFPVQTSNGPLPPGADLGSDSLDQPTELFASEEAGGKRSYLLDLGDMAFSAPTLLGRVARQAGLSCNSCHQNGAGNAALFIPGLSTRHGTVDTTGALFDPRADNGVLDAVTPPSLRGIRYLAPYGHDGRFASLRDFTRNVIVNEFAGPEPSPEMLDGLVAYMQEIEFLPNGKLGAGGRLTGAASAAAHRGEAVFKRPFPGDAALSCAACHGPTAAFVDHKPHDVGTGGLVKTPTLINADFNAPYFHDGRYDSYDEVVGYFDRFFGLGLSAQDRHDLIAYLKVVGNADHPFTRDSLALELGEIENFAHTLDESLSRRDEAILSLAVDTIGGEWRELSESFPGRDDPSVAGGLAERLKARAAIADLVLQLRRIAIAADRGDFGEGGALLADYHRRVAAAKPLLLAAEPWSLFNPVLHDAHFGALKRLATAAAPKS